jgi:AcrR family transcriptional regulator
VADAQRVRLVVAMAEALADGGYVATPIAAVLRRAKVSRETFYELYPDKLACFLEALDLVGEVLVAELDRAAASPQTASPLHRAEHAIDRYLATVAAQPAFARLYLVEVHAAGAEAMRRRERLQERLADGLARVLGARTASERFAVRAFVAATSALVATPLATGDLDAVAALRRPLRTHLRALAGGGLVGPATTARPGTRAKMGS